MSTLFRNEDSGEMHGLIRVRQFTISEGHLILRPDQLEEEFKGCLDMAQSLRAQGYRVEVDSRNEKVGRKIRDALLEKIPYMLVIGDREVESGSVSVRHRSDGDLGAMPFAEFQALFKEVVDSKSKK